MVQNIFDVKRTDQKKKGGIRFQIGSCFNVHRVCLPWEFCHIGKFQLRDCKRRVVNDLMQTCVSYYKYIFERRFVFRIIFKTRVCLKFGGCIYGHN